MTTLRTDSTHSGITIEYANGSGFVHGGSGPLTVYSDDEKAAINALTDADDDTYYLFLVSSVTKLDADGNNTVVSGYMPVGYQHGFIFEQFDVARTFAHELSHGAFALHHTFSANTESFRADEGTTNNLMDYTRDGTTLNHKQWRWMHENHGKGLFGFLADEESGEYREITSIRWIGDWLEGYFYDGVVEDDYGVKVVNNKPGGWGSNDAITTIKELREDMAVLESWKKLEYEPTRVKYRVTKELPVRNGVVGPQIDSYAEETIYFDIFVSYKGGNQQYEIVLPKEANWRDNGWEKYLKEIERVELK